MSVEWADAGPDESFEKRERGCPDYSQDKAYKSSDNKDAEES
ncbi:MAG: hypothetical protein RMH84_02455 [Sulfolobales archaeon]|nr:hypothetical protein [Sulfolobales archaeon]MCX8209300.1 hypothetical protein [Sulfolobales archaeon]MDW8010439.1 hypothetical protein [Sulfolobales archaeon]